MDKIALTAAAQALCDALSDEEDTLKRDILSHAGNRWSLGVVYVLGTRGTLRHADIARALKGVTQRMLTRTLRHLERDGLITRHDYQLKHPRVEYRLTPLGEGLLAQMFPLWTWVLDNAAAFRDARAAWNEDTPAAYRPGRLAGA